MVAIEWLICEKHHRFMCERCGVAWAGFDVPDPVGDDPKIESYLLIKSLINKSLIDKDKIRSAKV